MIPSNTPFIKFYRVPSQGNLSVKNPGLKRPYYSLEWRKPVGQEYEPGSSSSPKISTRKVKLQKDEDKSLLEALDQVVSLKQFYNRYPFRLHPQKQTAEFVLVFLLNLILKTKNPQTDIAKIASLTNLIEKSFNEPIERPSVTYTYLKILYGLIFKTDFPAKLKSQFGEFLQSIPDPRPFELKIEFDNPLIFTFSKEWNAFLGTVLPHLSFPSQWMTNNLFITYLNCLFLEKDGPWKDVPMIPFFLKTVKLDLRSSSNFSSSPFAFALIPLMPLTDTTGFIENLRSQALRWACECAYHNKKDEVVGIAEFIKQCREKLTPQDFAKFIFIFLTNSEYGHYLNLFMVKPFSADPLEQFLKAVIYAHISLLPIEIELSAAKRWSNSQLEASTMVQTLPSSLDQFSFTDFTDSKKKLEIAQADLASWNKASEFAQPAHLMWNLVNICLKGLIAEDPSLIMIFFSVIGKEIDQFPTLKPRIYQYYNSLLVEFKKENKILSYVSLLNLIPLFFSEPEEQVIKQSDMLSTLLDDTPKENWKRNSDFNNFYYWETMFQITLRIIASSEKRKFLSSLSKQWLPLLEGFCLFITQETKNSLPFLFEYLCALGSLDARLNVFPDQGIHILKILSTKPDFINQKFENFIRQLLRSENGSETAKLGLFAILDELRTRIPISTRMEVKHLLN